MNEIEILSFGSKIMGHFDLSKMNYGEPEHKHHWEKEPQTVGERKIDYKQKAKNRKHRKEVKKQKRRMRNS